MSSSFSEMLIIRLQSQHSRKEPYLKKNRVQKKPGSRQRSRALAEIIFIIIQLTFMKQPLSVRRLFIAPVNGYRVGVDVSGIRSQVCLQSQGL